MNGDCLNLNTNKKFVWLGARSTRRINTIRPWYFYCADQITWYLSSLTQHTVMVSKFRSLLGSGRHGKAMVSSSSVALQPGVGLGLLYNTPPGLSIPCSVSPFVYPHVSQVRGHVIQPSHFWSSFSSCCMQLSVQHLFWNCGVLHSLCVTKPSYSLAFNEPDSVLHLNYSF